ncbi:MAG: malate dehydrogenase [bacterium]|nr:malate dehydrogenase [bacterium]
MKAKVSIIGAGNVGATLAQLLAIFEISDVVLYDIVKDMPQGKALDINQMLNIFYSDSKVIGTNDYKDIKNSDIIVITAGLARKPGMSREELLSANASIIKEVSENIPKYCENCIVIVVSNPLDAMTYLTYKILSNYGFDRTKVMGMAGVLDSSRFVHFISEKLNVSKNNINAFVLGSHGDTMVPSVKYTTVSGVSLRDLVDLEVQSNLIERTRKGGAEIVSLLKNSSAYYAPAAATFKMIKSIIFDKKEILPISVYVNGEYGYKDIVIGLPVVLGKNGIEKIIEFDLEENEKKELDISANKISELCKELYNLKVLV